MSKIDESIFFKAMKTETYLKKKYNETEQVELIAEYKTKIFELLDNCGKYFLYKNLGKTQSYFKYKSETEYFKLNIEDNSKSLEPLAKRFFFLPPKIVCCNFLIPKLNFIRKHHL